MNEAELARLQEEVVYLSRSGRTQRWLLVMALASVVALASAVLWRPEPVAARALPDKDGVLHVRGLIVEDQTGRERVRLGAPLPDPVIQGVRQKRSGAVSGLVILDSKGNERGGLVTADASGEALIGLDSESEQKVLLLANPNGGVNLVLTNNDGNLMQFTVFPEGPKLTITKAKKTALELP